ncbi:MAG: hypothetical protein J7L88_00375, partial [Thermoplasmata archaeon]|nr:hypothetical protein [Thermoplasmata archaeon]
MQRIGTIVVFFALIASAFVIPATFLTYEVGASMGETDDFGYYWVDSKSPEPIVQYSWIDATTSGTEISDQLSSSYSYTEVDLPFNFTFYGTPYDSMYVTSKGYVSFVDNTVSSYGNELPDGVSPNGVIAVYWSYPYFCSYASGVWIANGVTGDGVRYFVVEWHKGGYDLTYELILYETGEIKLQYKDVVATSTSYSNGKRATVGIENEDGTIGLTYSYNQEVITNNLAILFTPYKTDVKVEMTDGDGDGHIVLAGYRYYNLHIETYLEGGIARLKTISIFFGDVSSYVYLQYSMGSGLLNISAVNPDDTYLLVDAWNSTYLNDGITNWTFDVKVMFTPLFPLRGNLSVKAVVLTYHAGIGFKTVDDVLFLENQFYLIGEMKAYVNKGTGWEYAAYNSWVRDRIPLRFTGQRIVYNCTLNDTLFTQPIHPPNGVFYFVLTDEDGVKYYDNTSSGREYDFLLTTGKIGKVKVFELSVGGIPEDQILNMPDSYLLRVDDDIPPPPSGFVIHADSFRDPRTDVDNDDELFLTWVKTVDQSSGILGYYLNDTFNITNPQGIFISADNDRFIWNRTQEGEYNIFIWAEDRVGHFSTPVRAKILIDKQEVSFYGFVVSPIGEGDWVKSASPVCMIKVKDFGGSGVLGDSIEYQYSPSGLENMTDWIPADLY